MTHFLEKWAALDPGLGYDVVDAADVRVCTIETNLGLLGSEYARRIAACVNAMAGLSTEDVERKFGEHPVEYWLRTVEGALDEVIAASQEQVPARFHTSAMKELYLAESGKTPTFICSYCDQARVDTRGAWCATCLQECGVGVGQ